jgi:putative ATP-dependent endonuclease of OLD family
MYLSKLSVRNYRSIKEIDIDFFEWKNVIVGRNNAGKSNIIKALDLVLWDNSPTRDKSQNITESDFYKWITWDPIYIFCELTKTEWEIFDFRSISKSAIFSIFTHAKNWIEEIKEIDDYYDMVDELFYYETEEWNAQLDNNENTYGKRRIWWKPYCKKSFAIEFANTSKIILWFQARIVDEKIEKYLCMRYSDDWVTWKRWCNAWWLRNVFLQSAIIPAFRDTKDQLRISAYGWYGKLLKSFVKSDSTDLLSAFESVKSAWQEVFKDLHEKIWDNKINIAFPNTKISFQFNPEKQEVYKNTQIYVDDGFNSPLQDKGSGIQSAVIIWLFDFYIKNIVKWSSALLAIEEPELYLHPHGRRVISDRLNDFLEWSKNQVIVTTHASEFIGITNENINIIYVSKDENWTDAKNVNFNTPQKKQLLLKPQNYDIFFASFVILSEDAKLFLHEIAKEVGLENEQLWENRINNNNISIINVWWKTDIVQYIECILDPLWIEYVAIADFDYIRDWVEKIKVSEKDKQILNTYKSQFNATEKVFDFSDVLKGLTDKIWAKDRDNWIRILDEIENELKKLKNPNGKYKTINDLEEESKEKANEIMKIYSQNYWIFILPCELENFYLTDRKPKNKKERWVYETIEKILNEWSTINDYIDTTILKDIMMIISKNFIPSDNEEQSAEDTWESKKEDVSPEDTNAWTVLDTKYDDLEFPF